jgi:anti-sigma regulatory factor (Ser/Thr protein kinase)
VVTATLTVPGRVEFVRPATLFLVQAARALHVEAAAAPAFEVAVSEAITNAVKHGSSQDPGSTITCGLELDDRTLTLRIADDGQGFVPARSDLPETSPDALALLPASGYGLRIIHTVFPIVRAVRVDGRFALELSVDR